METARELTQQMKDEFVGAAHGDCERVKAMLEKHPELADVTASWGETPIQAAAQMARTDIAGLLLDAGAPLDICTASALGMADRVRAFIEEDPSQINATGAHDFPLMHFPVVGGHKAVAELLAECGADVSAGEGLSTPLHAAAATGNVEMAAWLVSRGAKVSSENYEGKTPLQVAIESGSAEVVELLRRYDGA